MHREFRILHDSAGNDDNDDDDDDDDDVQVWSRG